MICEELKRATVGPRIIGNSGIISIDTNTINESLLITQPRYKNLAVLFSTYPNVHLFTPAMVDLLMGAGGSDLPIPNQVELMSDLIVATRGRMLPFVPFDPMRELKFQQARDKQTWQPLKLVTTAIEEKGFIGVKLYPPMGFAPTGNKMRACPNCADDNFFGHYKDSDNLYESFRERYGDAIDHQISVLLEYCARNGVPVMAHANNSNMANGACVEHVVKGDYLGSPSQWREALHAYGIDKELRLNLAHFGRIDEIYAGKASRTPINHVDGKRIADDLVNLIGEDNKVYADLANFGLTTSSPKGLQDEIRNITANGSGTVSKKLLYGSDWHMLADYARWPSYFHDFSTIIDDTYKARFFGLNAVDFLGLKKGEKSRNRIDAFFKRNQISRENNNLPTWVDLVDAIA